MIDYNGRFCMSLGGDRGEPRPSASTAACPSRSPTSPGPRTVLLVGGNPADTMPPAMQYFDAGRAARARTHIVVDPRRTADRRRRDPAPAAPLPGTDLALANGLLHIAMKQGLVDEDYVARRTTRLRRGPGRRRRLLAGPGRADHRRSGSAQLQQTLDALDRPRAR